MTEFTKLTNLAAENLGAKALSCSDDFFAEMENLLKPGRGISIPDKFTERGKWMDGWESRRKRVPGHDWCIIELAVPGKIKGVDIDTNHFLGNHPPFASIDACYIAPRTTVDIPELSWIEILTISPLHPGSQNLYPITDEGVYTHLRLNIYPDGGIARFKVYGEVVKDWSLVKAEEEIDFAAALNGARTVLCNDMFFSPMENLIMPGRAINIGDGWQTKRNRDPDNRDWVIIRLAHPGVIHRVVIDTGHFKGNYPESCLIEAPYLAATENVDLAEEEIQWSTVLPEVKLMPDREHIFENEITAHDAISHVRLSIYPDGGLSRMRLWGKLPR